MFFNMNVITKENLYEKTFKVLFLIEIKSMIKKCKVKRKTCYLPAPIQSIFSSTVSRQFYPMHTDIWGMNNNQTNK